MIKSQIKKLKGTTIKTAIGEITLRQQYRIDNCEYDQIYFKCTGIDGICKIYDLKQATSIQRFTHQMQQYTNKYMNIIYDKIHCQQIKIKKYIYGLIFFYYLDQEQNLTSSLNILSTEDKIQLVITLLSFLQQLKEMHKIYCIIRPINIYKINNKFVIINTQYLRNEGTRNHMNSLMLQTIQNNWQYWPSQFVDPYSHEIFDYGIDVYAVGCILYELQSGRYPFETKLKAMNNEYIRLQNNNLINKIIKHCLGPNRKNINFKELINKLSNRISQISNNDLSSNISYHQQKYIKTNSNGILDNISTVFSKMMNDYEGWFLNYVEDDQKMPNEKYLDNILYKMYKNIQKNQKFYLFIQKYIITNYHKINSILKVLLLMGQLSRKGPSIILTNIIINIKAIHIKCRQYAEIQLFSSLLVKKIQLNQKFKGVMSANFYLYEISDFKKISIQHISLMVNYLQQLIFYLRKQPQMDTNSELSQYIIHFVCDQIYDLISTIIMYIISLRKDNELQLRRDKLSDLIPIQKNLNICLRKISEISNCISAHAIYALQVEYIPYQQQLILKTNPYYSTLQYFYYHSRIYKGLTVPINYFLIFYSNTKEDKKMPVSANKMPRNIMTINSKNFGNQRINFNDQIDFKLDIPQRLHQDNGAKYSRRQQLTARPKKQQHLKQNDKSYKICINGQQFPKQSQQIRQKYQKIPNTISIQQFSNIHKLNKQYPQQSIKIFDQFQQFNQIKNKQIANNKKQHKNSMHKNKQHANNNNNNKNFLQFEHIFNQNNNNNKSVLLLLSDTKSLYQNKSSINFDLFSPFTDQMAKPRLDIPQHSNPLYQKILKNIKLKQLKDLLKKNQKILIQFHNLKLLSQIGSGSAGEVFYGKYLNEQVAIKRIKIKQNPNALKQFQRQLVTYIKIKSNPNLVSLTGISQSNGNLYLVTQFCSQGSLFSLLHNKKLQISLTWKQRLNFAIQIAQGMQSLHSMKPIIIHRDLKSLNVLVGKNNKNQWKLKIADFGLSRSPQADMMTTQLGTIHWMAPQLLQGKQYSSKVDIYSYGILLFQILSRMTPYTNLHNPMAILKYVVMDKKRPNIQIIPKQCPTQLINVMKKCWTHEPNDRPSFTQIIKFLQMINL